jgi:hypothetical protein
MNLWSAIAIIFGGAVGVNGIPHLVSGVMGRQFPSPFAKPPGKGLSSATVNVIWGFANLCVSYVLTCAVAKFNPESPADVALFATGFLLGALLLAQIFGPLHGSDLRR